MQILTKRNSCTIAICKEIEVANNSGWKEVS